MKPKHILLLLLTPVFCLAQQWTWMRGVDTSLVPGNYGNMGIASPANDPGGRHGCATWTDKNGDLWLFGGEGYSNSNTLSWLNDLWKYDKTNNQWTWMRGSNGPDAAGIYGTKGTASPGNDPGAREFSISWTDTSGKFWLFGGDGFDSNSSFGKLGDLWMYDPSTNMWTWVHGFNTINQYGLYGTLGVPSGTAMPGGRYGSAYWVDSNNDLWLMGGLGYPQTGAMGYLQDLWKYNIAQNEWTWVKGTNLSTQPGTYGTMSVTAPTNLPGGRAFPGFWYGKDNNVYIFGGVGHSTVTLNGHLSDFWKYDPAGNTWTWIGGPNTSNQNGDYGTQGQASPSVKPGARQSPAAWVDDLGKLWLFGGYGYPGQGSSGNLNDLLCYNPLNGLWEYVKGDTIIHAPGVYGTMGVPSNTNKPGGRQYNSWWKGTGSTLWMLGGLGRDKNTIKLDNMNDLWKFEAPCNPEQVNISGGLICSGSSSTLTVMPPDNSTLSWYQSPSSTISIGTGSTFITAPLQAQGSQVTYSFYVSAASCTASPRSLAIITVQALPAILINAPQQVCQGQIYTANASGASTFTWQSGANASSTSFTASFPADTLVVLGTENGCENSTMVIVQVNALPLISVTASPENICAKESITLSASGAISYSWNTGNTNPSFNTNTLSAGNYTFEVTGTDANLCSVTESISVTVNACVGLNEQNLQSSIIYPNPATNHIRLRTNSQGTLVIRDCLGAKVAEKQVNNREEKIMLHLPSGIYLTEFNGNFTGRLVIVQ